MGARLLVAAVVGIAAGVILTRVILYNDFIRIWLVNVPSLLVWGSAFAVGIVVGLVAPPMREASTAAISVLIGSVVGIVIFGLGLNFSLADETVLTYLFTTFLFSGICLLVLAALGGMLAGAIRDSQQSGTSYGSRYGRSAREGSRRYREPPERY